MGEAGGPDGPQKSEAPVPSRPRDRSPGKTLARREQDALWAEVLSLAAYVEDAFKTSIAALHDPRPDLIAAVRAEEDEIDRWEVRIESQCLRVLALYDLVASDLRRVVAALRVNRDLEGLADLAENLAKRARKLNRDPASADYLPGLRDLADKSLRAVREGLDALRSMDADRARAVIEADHEVDLRRVELVGTLKTAIRERPAQVGAWLRLINSARNLERAADHATNIAESVVYVKEGVFLRRGNATFHDD